MKTPLYSRHIKQGARMAPFAGWDMPIQYTGIIEEHQWTRSKASIFDTCHMGEFDVRGPNAEADLECLVTQDVASLKEGRCRYGFMLNEEGGVLDDLTVYRRGPDHFFVVVNAGTHDADADWMASHCSPETTFTNLSPNRAKIDIQGPESRRAIERILGQPLPDLGYFAFTDITLWDVPCTLSRTGYTGEWGYEIYLPDDAAERFWDRFTANGLIKPAGLGARDTLRLEMGYALYGHELSTDRSPVGASRGKFINRDKSFIGKSAVVNELDQGAEKYLVGLQLETKRAARQGAPVIHQGKTVGQLTSGSLSPSLGVAVAMAYVDADLTRPGQDLHVDVRGKPLASTVVELPFYKKGSARKK